MKFSYTRVDSQESGYGKMSTIWRRNESSGAYSVLVRTVAMSLCLVSSLLFLASIMLAAQSNCDQATDIMETLYPYSTLDIVYVGNALNDTNIIHGIVSPREPLSLTIDELEAIVFRANVPHEEQIAIYLGKGSQKGDDHAKVAALGSVTIKAGRIRDYMMLWTPRVSDGIEENGADDYFFIFKKSSWWGWRQETVYMSAFMAILPRQT